jgi:exodeoxyribonuclease VII large subunit
LDQQHRKLHAISQKFFELTPIHRIHQQKILLNQQMATLEALSPLAILKRGFSIVTSQKDQSLVRSIKQVKAQDKIDVQVTDGKIECIVSKVD